MFGASSPHSSNTFHSVLDLALKHLHRITAKLNTMIAIFTPASVTVAFESKLGLASLFTSELEDNAGLVIGEISSEKDRRGGGGGIACELDTGSSLEFPVRRERKPMLKSNQHANP